MKTWDGSEAGPIQVSKFKRAWSRLGTAYCSYRRKDGLVMAVFSLGRTENPQEKESEAAETRIKESIGERYGWKLTRANAKTVLAELESAYTERMAALPLRIGVGC